MFSKKYIDNYRKNLVLAYPIMLGQVGHIITGMADTIMVGQIGSDYLAAASYAHSIYIILFLVGIGIGIGLTPLVGISHGEGNTRQAGEYLKNGLLVFTFTGIVMTLLNFMIYPFLGYLGQPENVVELSKPYFIILALTSIPYMFFVTFKQFTEGIELTLPAMIISLTCNLLNIFLNYMFIYGVWFFPEWKLFGAGIATLIARIMMGLSFALYIFYHPRFKIYLRNINWKRYSFNQIKMILKIGLPIGMQTLLEVGIFSIGAVIVGWSGQYSLAAHQIALSLAAFTFLAASGIASASTIRLSNKIGERKFSELRATGLSAFIMVILFMSMAAIIFYVFRYQLTGFFGNDENVMEIAVKLLIIAGLFQIFDGTQVTALGALRGLKDVKIPTIISFCSYWLIGMTSCFIFAVYFNLGAVGVWYGYLMGLIAAAVLLFSRFLYIVRKIELGKLYV